MSSLARPGGNVTGLTNLTPALLGKRLELLKEAVPKVSRFAVLDTVGSLAKPMFKEAEVAAQALGAKLQLIEVNIPDPDLEGAFRVMAKERIGGLITGSGTLSLSLYRKKILDLVKQSPYTSDLSVGRVDRCRRPDALWGEHPRFIPPRRDVRRQDFERCQARRSAGGAAEEV